MIARCATYSRPEAGPSRLDRNSRLLWRDDEIVSLTPKVIDLLLFLVENKGGLITKHRSRAVLDGSSGPTEAPCFLTKSATFR
jgi:DNA-binding winged helix-turn-helix (wHTH) protein